MSGNQPSKKVVIIGGGTAGWMAASAMCELLASKRVQHVEVIESPDLPTVGVGEATVPGIRNFNAHLGIDEIEFIKRTNATFKLGIEFDGWAKQGKPFFHPFSNYGAPIQGVDFHHCVHSASNQLDALKLSDFSLSTEFARQGKFAQPPENITHPLADYKYAFHMDAILYAGLLKEYAIERGVVHHQDMVVGVTLEEDTGFIKQVVLESGRQVEGDLFIDCTGFKGVLIEGALNTGYEDWSHWLPVDRAIAVGSRAQNANLRPYTVSSAQEAGWTWRIPLQHREGNGYVYCSDHCSDEQAAELLMNNINGEKLGEPKTFRFTTGRRKKFWNKNCVSLGLASGFLEPLESTSISLIQTGISKLMMFFPDHGFNQSDVDEANRLAELEMENIRDFLILHYRLNQREGQPFWDAMRSCDIPDSLAHKIALFQHRGHIVQHELESFEEASWLSVYSGMGVSPMVADPKAVRLPIEQTLAYLKQMRQLILDNVSKAPSHSDFIAKHCAAPK